MTEARESKRQRKRHGNIGTRQTRYERELTHKEQRTKQMQKHKEIPILNLSPEITNSLRKTQITVMVTDPGS